MTEVISVRFRSGSKNYFFDPRGVQVRMGDQVIVQTAQGLELAICTQGNHEVGDEAIVKPLSAMVRLANDNDRRILEYNHRKEREAFDICERKIADHGLVMKLVNVSAAFDSNKIVFYFTADGRVDFRELVRDLASVFRARIELRQIGVRDEAKMIGGLGICGRPFCCSSFLESFMPVSIKMAKTQNLSLNPTKISGTCGRLMCCLKYEQNVYEDAARRMPRLESFVQTPDGPGNVKSVDLLREMVKVSLDSAPEVLKSYHNCEIQVLRNGKGSRDGIELPDRPARFVEEKEDEEPVPPVFSVPFHMDSPGPAEKTENKPFPRRRRNPSGSNHNRKPPRPSGGKQPRSGGKPPVKGEPRNSEGKRRQPYRGGRRWNKGEQPNKG